MKFTENEQGFTLVEIMASLSILFLLLTVAGSSYLFVNNSYIKTADKLESNLISEEVLDFVTENLVYVTDLELSYLEIPSIADYNYMIKLQKDGRIYLNGKDIYGDLFYDDKTLEWNFVIDSNCLSITLKLIKNGLTINETNGAIKLVNLPLKQKEIKVSDNQSITNTNQTIYLYLKRNDLLQLEGD